MPGSKFIAVLDACVLYPAALRDFLVSFGLSGRATSMTNGSGVSLETAPI